MTPGGRGEHLRGDQFQVVGRVAGVEEAASGAGGDRVDQQAQFVDESGGEQLLDD